MNSLQRKFKAFLHPKRCDSVFKVIIIGDDAVGKSNLTYRFVENKYDRNYPATIGVNFQLKNIELEGKTIQLHIWDTACQERYTAVRLLYYRGADGVIVAYDVTSQDSFMNVKKWLKEVYCNAPENVNLLLVGNKCDLTQEKVVDSVIAEEYADQLGISFLETSAKEAINVEQAFLTIAAEIKRRKDPLTSASDASQVEDIINSEKWRKQIRAKNDDSKEEKENEEQLEDTLPEIFLQEEDVKEEKEKNENSCIDVATQTDEEITERMIDKKNHDPQTEIATQTEEKIWKGKLKQELDDTYEEEYFQGEEQIEIEQLKENFKEMLYNSNINNIVLKVGNQESRSHRCVIVARSPVFFTIIFYETQESIFSVIDFKDIHTEAFPDFLNYLCTGNIEKLTFENAMKLYTTAVTYKIVKLKGICMDHLLMNITSDNFCDLLTFSLHYDEKDLKEACYEYFLKNSLTIFLTTKWRTFLCENPIIGNELFVTHLKNSK